VREVIRDGVNGVNGVLVPFFDAAHIGQRIEHALLKGAESKLLRDRARQTARHYAFEAATGAYSGLMSSRLDTERTVLEGRARSEGERAFSSSDFSELAGTSRAARSDSEITRSMV
jgi:hypothetical protein